MEQEESPEGATNKALKHEGSETDLLGEQEIEPASVDVKFVVKRSLLYTLCLSHFLSAWGDRMWAYAVSLFLVTIDCNSLLLPAIYGFVMASSVVFFGTLVGDWVDANPRLKVVKWSLIIENGLVVLSAGSLLVLLLPQLGIDATADTYHTINKNWVYYVCIILMIVLSSTAYLATTATKIAVERDWVVVIAHKDKEELASVNAKLKRIDLFCKIVAPIPVSLIMSASLWGGALFIVVLNVISFFIEYALLVRIYHQVPELAIKEGRNDAAKINEDARESDKKDKNGEEEYGSDENLSDKKPSKSTCFSKMTSSYRTLIRGWKTYRRQKAFLAGLGMSFLYMTVLAFGGILNGFLRTQGMAFWQISIFQGAAAAMALLGTFIYPRLRRSVGLTRTGLIALGIQFGCLLLCGASVFMPGNPRAEVNKYDSACKSQPGNVTVCVNVTSSPPTVPSNFSYSTPNFHPTGNSSLPGIECRNETGGSQPDLGNPFTPSIIALVVGIIPSRIGLWMFDCVLVQIYQETVPPGERGIVGGVQSVLNSNFDVIRFVLVMALHQPSQFGILMLLSLSLVGLGYVLYASYSRSVRGHLFHFDAIVKCGGKRKQDGIQKSEKRKAKSGVEGEELLSDEDIVEET